jgi:hypothetical protein
MPVQPTEMKGIERLGIYCCSRSVQDVVRSRSVSLKPTLRQTYPDDWGREADDLIAGVVPRQTGQCRELEAMVVREVVTDGLQSRSA